ncbi:hypothetical protein TUBRATIS_007390 [Tubulinosema ratisbonensis]|uniref:Cyclin N-terminal domain-containing protein n=1 Tax=Tubulinosema ratisbonensis TaxID=291195 RepID=A0A437ANJ7_9MICR|nr:hypothetical protein TUBRATIS_007390 [Tubulinosema ratisbonensis]
MNNKFSLEEEILTCQNRTETLKDYLFPFIQNKEEIDELILMLKKVKITFVKLFCAVYTFRKIKEIYCFKTFNENVSKFTINKINYELIQNKQLVFIVCVILAHKSFDDNFINLSIWSKISKYSKNNLFLGEYVIIKLLNFNFTPKKEEFLEVKCDFCLKFNYFEIKYEGNLLKEKLKTYFIKMFSCFGNE